MKKEVWLSICSKQRFVDCEEEEIEMMTAATLYERGGKYYVVYDESSITGLEGTRTTVKMDGKNVMLLRAGAYPTQLMFSELQRHVGVYHTPGGGQMTLATYTRCVDNTVSERGGRLILDYTLEIDHTIMGEHYFEMTVAVPENRPSRQYNAEHGGK